jgi:hypothetical protein
VNITLAFFAALQLAAAEGEVLPPSEGEPPMAAEVETPATVAPEPEVELPERAPNPEVWAGEQKRFHFGVGAALHVGFMVQRGVLFVLSQSEAYAAFSIRLIRHDELRVHVGIAAGIPDLFGGETNISYRHHVTPRFSFGIGVFGYWGAPSFRLGVEVPLALRLGATRRHEISVALRFHAGVFNNSTYVWYDFPRLAFAYATDLAVAYTFFF